MRSAKPQTRCRANRAFTTIELLVAIGILVVLIGMALYGMRSITNSSRARATHVALENCRSMLAEREAMAGLGSGPASWVWQNGTFAAPGATLNYWKNPGGILDAPGYVKDDPEGHRLRNGARAIVNTTLIMNQLAAIPKNRTALAAIPKEQLFTPEWLKQENLDGPGADGVLNTQDDISGSTRTAFDPVLYAAGSRVKIDSQFYICLADHQSPAAFAGPPTWAPDPAPVPILRDGWNNPIIFVPASGLSVRLLKDKKDNDPTDPTQTQVIRSPDNRPFFASAGPDGDFSKGDDNVYSFEQ